MSRVEYGKNFNSGRNLGGRGDYTRADLHSDFTQIEIRAEHTRRRTEESSEKERHADDGRNIFNRGNRGGNVDNGAVEHGNFSCAVHIARTFYFGLRRRLFKSRAQTQSRAVGAIQIGGANFNRNRDDVCGERTFNGLQADDLAPID